MNTPSLDVLVVEDDPALRQVLDLHLRAEGFAVRSCGDGAEALARCQERRPDVVVLDVMLPSLSGIQVCASLRAHDPLRPAVLFVTARSSEVDVVLGLEVGGDDYVIKPCRPREIIARVRALARRLSLQPPASPPPARPASPAADLVSSAVTATVAATISRGRLQIHPGSRRVQVDGGEVRLTPMEFSLLLHLAQAPDQVFTRAQLLESLWESMNEGYQRNVDCHITRLRRKLEAAGLVPVPIETVHGIGYRFLPS